MVKAAALGVMRTLARTPLGERLRFEVEADDALAIEMDPDDLNEVIGNLIENAARVARETVRIRANLIRDQVRIEVSDDGPGVDCTKFARLVERGRLDEAAGSAGLGLAIVADILEAYGAKPELGVSNLGGLGVSFTVRVRIR